MGHDVPHLFFPNIVIFILKANAKMLNLLYFYSDGCDSCHGYSKVVERLSLEFPFDDFKMVNIAEEPVAYDLRGVPTVIIESENGVIFEQCGSLPLPYLRKAIKREIDAIGDQ